MPGSLDVIGDPIINGLVVFFGVRNVLVHLGRVVCITWLVPCTHVDSHGKTVGEDFLGCLEIDILARRRRVGMEMRMVRRELSAEG